MAMTTENYDNLTQMPEFWDQVEGRARSNDVPGPDAEVHGEKFTAQWIFQRFVNRVMEMVTTPECPWYCVAVEGPELVRKGGGYFVVIFFTIFAPLFFVLVFGVAAVLLPFLLLPCGWTNFPRREVVQAWVLSVLYLWCAVFPPYFIWHKYVHEKEGDHYHSYFSALLVTVACCAAGFRMTHAILVSACRCVCQKELSRVQNDAHYGQAVREVQKVLSDPKDEWSSHLFFQGLASADTTADTTADTAADTAGVTTTDTAADTAAETAANTTADTAANKADEVSDGWRELQRKHAKKLAFFVVSVVVLHAQHMWNDVVIAPDKVLMLAMLITTSFASAVGMCLYLKDFHRALHEYEHVVKALTIFIYLGARNADKHQEPLKSDYQKIMKEFQNGDKRISKLESIAQQSAVRQNELVSMEVCRVAINFTTPQGVFFYGQLHTWMTTCVHTPSSEIQMFMNMSLFFIISGVLRLIVIMMENNFNLVAAFSADASFKFLPAPLIVLCVHMWWSLDCCADVNKQLFDNYKRILFGWKANLLNPLSEFRGAPLPAVGWYYNDKGNVAELPYKGWGEDDDDDDALQKSCQALDVTIDVCTAHGCKKQRMFGMEITQEFRTRLMISLCTPAVPFLMKVAWKVLTCYLAKHSGQSDKFLGGKAMTD